MRIYSQEDKPANMTEYRKRSTIFAYFSKEPFMVDTQEGPMHISPETCDDWDGGYYLAYPSDGSKPYAISPSFMKMNYVVK